MNGLALTSTDRDEMRRQGLIKDRDMSVSEAARALGITPKMIRSAIRRGALPAIEWGPHCTRITRADLLAWKFACQRAAAGTSGPSVTSGTSGAKSACLA